MKKLLVLVCILGLVLGFVSAASAVPYTSSLFFKGFAWYSAPESDLLNGDGNTKYGGGLIGYYFDWDLPDFGTTADWTLDVDFWAHGIYLKDGEWDGFRKHFSHTFDLGTFALADYGSEIWSAQGMIEGFVDAGEIGDFLEFNLYGGWHGGLIDFGIYEPILEDWDISKALVLFKGEMNLNASPVPEPATMFLLGTGLIGLAGFGRKRFRKK